MNFVLLINEGPYTHQASNTAYHFAQAALLKQHTITEVFFYLDGVHNATRLSCPPSDELALVEAWQRLAKTYPIKLSVCIAAALRRGVLNADEAERYARDTDNLAAPFQLAGMGQLMAAALAADRFLVFGD